MPILFEQRYNYVNLNCGVISCILALMVPCDIWKTTTVFKPAQFLEVINHNAESNYYPSVASYVDIK